MTRFFAIISHLVKKARICHGKLTKQPLVRRNASRQKRRSAAPGSGDSLCDVLRLFRCAPEGDVRPFPPDLSGPMRMRAWNIHVSMCIIIVYMPAHCEMAGKLDGFQKGSDAGVGVSAPDSLKSDKGKALFLYSG